MRHHLFSIVYAILTVCVLVSAVSIQLKLKSYTPPGTEYAYVSGHTGDFYMYSYMIRQGREGHLLYHNAYTEEDSPDGLIHPFFQFIGFISRPFTVTPFQVFFIARMGMLLLMFFAVYFLIRAAIVGEGAKILAGILFMTATSFWKIMNVSGAVGIVGPKTWNDYFDMYSKYTRIPPHHFLAFACFIGIIIFLSKKCSDWKSVGISICLSVALGLLQPYLSFILILVVFANTAYMWMTKRITRPEAIMPVVVSVVSVIFILLNSYILQKVLRLPFASIGLSGQPRNVSVMTYIGALGPLALVAPWLILHPAYRAKPIVRMLMLWAILPVILFILPEVSNVTSTNRLFQTYQQIPLALLGAIVVAYIARKTPKPLVVIASIVSLSLLYGTMSYCLMTRTLFSQINTNYFNVYIPGYLLDSFQYLDHNTLRDSVVLGGVNVSNMVPVFSHNKVLIGHDSDTTSFPQKQAQTVAFFNGNLSPSEIYTFLRTYKISYILFGIDSPIFQNTPYVTSSVFTEIYTNKPVSIVKVNL